MKLIVLTILIAAAAAAKFDSSRCAHGPEYWCQHRNTAQECGAIQYCQDNVWPKAGVTADMCTDCKNFFGDVQKLLVNSTVQQMIFSDIKMICDDLGPYADQCNSYVDQYGPLVLDFLSSELDPTSVCNTIGFCSAKYFRSGSNMCSDCDAFFGDVQNVLKNATIQQEIENLIVTACQKLGLKDSDCSLIVAVAPEVFNFLASELDPKTICTAIKFCQSSLLRRYNSVEFNGNDQCADCKAFFGDVETILQNKTVENEIVQDVLAVCNYAGQYQAECKLAIQDFLPKVLTQLAGYMDPNAACPAIGFCPSNEPVEELKTNEVALVNADMCTDCKNFFGDVKTVLMNATDQDIIVNALKTVCADLGSYADQCNSYVDQYGKLVISLIASSLDAGTICNDIGFCTSGILKLTGDTCADCEAFFGDVQKLLENTTVQAMLMEDLKSFCSLFGSESDDCKSMIDSYGPLVFGLLASELDPKTTCTTIQFCKGAMTNTIAAPGFDMCAECKSVLSEIDAYLNNPTIQKELLAVIDVFCTSLGQFGTECKMLVNAFGPKVITELAALLEPNTFCTAFGFCSSQKKMVEMFTLTLAKPILNIKNNLVAKTNVIPAMEMNQAKPAHQKSDDSTICTVCTFVINELDRFLTDNATEAEIIAVVGKVCDYLPSAFKTECNALVSQYGGAIIELLVQKIQPSEICTKLNICTAKEMKVSASIKCVLCEFLMKELDSLISDKSTQQEILNALDKVCSLLPTILQDNCNKFVDTYTPEIFTLLQTFSPEQVCSALGLCTQKEMKVSASTECVLCEFLMKELDSLISDNSTQQEILNALDKVCSLLPTSLQDNCIKFVETYAPEMFTLLQTFSPEQVCSALGLCTQKVEKKVEASAECVLCKFIMQELETLVTENSTEQEILNALLEVCSLLPSSLQNDCDTFVNTYGAEIVDLLVKAMSPDAICVAIGVCDSSELLKVSASGGCIICEFVMKELDSYLSENATKDEIIKGLDKVCSLLPSTITADCTVFVSKYGDAIIELLLMELDPVGICTALTLCTDTAKLIKVTGEETCDLCKMVVMYGDEYLEKNSTTQEIIKVLGSVCAVLGDYRSKCESLVLQYGAVIPELLAQLLNPTKVCEELSLCQSSKKMLGEKECTYGPSYWCASMENAQKCNAVVHCKNHVWN